MSLRQPNKVAHPGDITNSSSTSYASGLILRGPADVVKQAEDLLASEYLEAQQICISSEIISINSSETQNVGLTWPSNVSTSFSEIAPSNPWTLGRIYRSGLTGLDASLSALETTNKAKVISRPSTVVQNGRQATIHIGQILMYETVGSVNSTGQPMYSTQTLPVGVTLQVLPQMSSDGVITLNITSVVSSATWTTDANGIQLPQVQETKSATTVQVHDGETLMIGGLKQNSTSVAKSGLPFLQKIPLIGPIFGSTNSTPSDQELMILVSPVSMKSLAAGTNPMSLLAPAGDSPGEQSAFEREIRGNCYVVALYDCIVVRRGTLKHADWLQWYDHSGEPNGHLYRAGDRLDTSDDCGQWDFDHSRVCDGGHNQLREWDIGDGFDYFDRVVAGFLIPGVFLTPDSVDTAWQAPAWTWPGELPVTLFLTVKTLLGGKTVSRINVLVAPE